MPSGFMREIFMNQTMLQERAPSVDPVEAAFFDRFASTWWDESGPFWPLHRLNALRAPFIRRLICASFDRDPAMPMPLQNLTALDIGCGGGILAESMARMGAMVHGIDVVKRNIDVARTHASANGLDIHYAHRSAESLAATGRSFDVVLNMEVVEHVADLDGFMAACGSLVRPGGLMFLATINQTALAWLVAIFGAEYVLCWLPRGTHHWRLLRRPKEVRDLLAQSGLHIVESTGVAANPFTRRMSLVRSHRVNYMLCAAKT